MRSPTVVLVEDEPQLRATLADALRVEGYHVHACASVADARALLAHSGAGVDAVLLDLGLPDGDGAELLPIVRAHSRAALLVLSARDAEPHKIALLDAGADDYLVKPFSLRELLARVRVALRHQGTRVPAALRQYHHGALAVDLEARRVLRDGVPVHLTPHEYALLARLVRCAGQVVTHRQLLADVWGPEYVDHTHYLRLYMGQLRAKLEAQPAQPQLLLTEPSVGYRLAEPQEP